MSSQRRPTVFEEAMERPSETRGCRKGIAFLIKNADGHTAKEISLLCSALADIAADTEQRCRDERGDVLTGELRGPIAGMPAESVHWEWGILLRQIAGEAYDRVIACGLKLPSGGPEGVNRPAEQDEDE